MWSYCLKHKKNTETKNPKVAQYDIKISKFIKQQEVGGLFIGLRIKTLSNKIPLLGPLLV